MSCFIKLLFVTTNSLEQLMYAAQGLLCQYEHEAAVEECKFHLKLQQSSLCRHFWNFFLGLCPRPHTGMGPTRPSPYHSLPFAVHSPVLISCNLVTPRVAAGL